MSDKKSSSQTQYLNYGWGLLGAIAALFCIIIVDSQLGTNADDRLASRILLTVTLLGLAGVIFARTRPARMAQLCAALSAIQLIGMFSMLVMGLGKTAVVIAINLLFISGFLFASWCFKRSQSLSK